MKAIKQTALGILLMILFINTGCAQNRDNLEESLPLDPEVKTGKLENGLTYYIRKNKQPENMIYLSLVVKAGSSHQDADQLQAAHMIEHLPFRKTKHFPNGQDDLIKRGININAATAGIFTSYYMNFMSSDSPENLKTGLRWMRDIGSMELEGESIEAERDAVLNEFFMNYESNTELNLIYQSFDDRITYKPMSEKNIKLIEIQSVKRFYDDWYRPELMGVFVVGDIESEAEIEQIIKNLFSDLKNPLQPRIKDITNADLDKENEVSIITHEAIIDCKVKLFLRQEPYNNAPITKNDFKTVVTRQLFGRMLSQRLSEISDQYNLPGYYIEFLNYPESLPGIMTDITRVKSVGPAIERGIIEFERIKHFGFLEVEFQRAKQALVRSFLSMDSKNSGNLINKYEAQFRNGQSSIANESAFLLQLAEEITLAEIHSFMKTTLNDKHFDVYVTAPQSQKSNLPDKTDIQKLIKQAQESRIEPYSVSTPPLSLMTDIESIVLKGKPFHKKKYIKEVGVTELILNNGLKVVLRPFQPQGLHADKILIHGFSPGGASLYSEKDYFLAYNSAQIIQNAGVGNLDKFELAKILSDKRVNRSVQPPLMLYVGDTEEWVEAGAVNKDIEILLQLIHLYFTSPRESEEAFNDWLDNFKHQQSTQATLQINFQNQIKDVIGYPFNEGRMYNHSITEPKDIDLERVYDIYQERFANAGDFTFVITGDFDVEEMTLLVNKYLGSLPDNGKRETVVHQERPKDQLPLKQVIRATQPMEDAIVEINFIGTSAYSVKNETDLKLLSWYLNRILYGRLRYEENGVYIVTTGPFFSKSPHVNRLRIWFRCAIADVDKLILATYEEIDKLQTQGPNNEFFKEAVNTQQGFLNSFFSSNTAAMNNLKNLYRNEESPGEILKQIEYLGTLTPKDLQEIAKKYLSKDQLYQFVLLPEKDDKKNKKSTPIIVD